MAKKQNRGSRARAKRKSAPFAPAAKRSGSVAAGTLSPALASGASYQARVTMIYTDTATGNSYVDSGTLTGRVT